MNYKFALSRPVEGEIKTVTIKRDNAGRLFVCFSVIQEIEPSEVSTNKIGGFDFGLKTFLTDDEGHTYQSPEVYRSALREIARLNRSLARKQRDSGNWKKAKRSLALAHSHLANKRRDSHFKLANHLPYEYDIPRQEGHQDPPFRSFESDLLGMRTSPKHNTIPATVCVFELRFCNGQRS